MVKYERHLTALADCVARCAIGEGVPASGVRETWGNASLSDGRGGAQAASG